MTRHPRQVESKAVTQHVPGMAAHTATFHPWLASGESPNRLWLVCRVFLMLLGIWLIFAWSTLGYLRQPLMWNGLVCGFVVLVLTALAGPEVKWPHWGLGAVGVWLLFAPLLFWAERKEAYDNSTAVGCLVAFFALIVPTVAADRASESPPGWSYNPSTWPQRLPIIALALIGFFTSRHMALYQLGYIESVWEPFFGNGTRQVLDSQVSKAFFVSDAGLGAFSYLVDAIAGAIGGTRRWRTMPWLVILFGILIIPPGVTSIVLVILQPTGVGAWCSLCLFAAFVMLFMVSPAFDEVIATAQFMKKSRRAGLPFWKTFFKGGTRPAAQPTGDQSAEPGQVSFIEQPWNLAGAAALGIWMMFTPATLNFTGAAATTNYFCGAMVVTFSILAISGVLRTIRWLNLPVALWLIIATWITAGMTTDISWTNLLVGLGVIGLSIRKGRIRHHYGNWNRLII